MKIEIIFRGTESSVAMENYVTKYVEKFKKYLHQQDPDSIFVHVVLEGKHNHHIMSVEVRVKSQAIDVTMKKEGHDMYPLIDETMKSVENELQRKKERLVDDIKHRKKCC
ncbi:HPF/RaiA family ribosome-associated protein [Candidatus Dependentiae bacterium]|nr:HPF/RaiA family ribosome-associated protein [Candidatus Dependentiae bacterium]